jgi:hypothetical protein
MKRRLQVLSCVFILVLSVVGVAYAFNFFLSQFNTKYGTAGTALNTCVLCHIPPGQTLNLNPYATDFLAAGAVSGDSVATQAAFTAVEPLDSDLDGFTNIAEIQALTFPGDPTSHPAAVDTVAPTVTAFVIPATSISLTVPITTFTATDNVAVTGYLVTESSTTPLVSDPGWTLSAPATHVFSIPGIKTLYAWAKDAAGHVSAPLSATVTITLPDVTPPTVTAFVIPSTATSLTVPITTFTATDDVGVTGYMVTESSTAPLAGAADWSVTAPTSFVFASAGAKTLYAWAKDAAGHVSPPLSATVVITLADTTPPTVTAFVIPPASGTLVVPITTFTATDDIAVTGYMVTETTVAPLPSDPNWSANPPPSYTFASAGIKTLYAWAKDGAGNVSTALVSATVTISLPDIVPPTVTDFTIPAVSNSLTVAILTFVATDNVAVTGYLATESASAPLPGAAGWSATPPPSYTFVTSGAKTLYAWAKDGAGLVSASLSAPVTITIPDVSIPVVTAFVLGQPTGLTVPITTFTAEDGSGIIGGFLVTETSAVPSPLLAQWTQAAPTSYTFANGGNKTLYAWAKDGGGNVSTALVSAVVTITPADGSPPVVTSFTIPATVQVVDITQAVIISVTAFTATDNVAVTGYLITESTTPPDPAAQGWSGLAPTVYTFAAGTSGAKTLYAWAKDAAGNVSASLSAPVTITLPIVYNPTNPTPNGTANESLTAALRITVHFPSPDGHVQRSATWEVCSDATFSPDKLIFRSVNDTVNLTQITIPPGMLRQNTMYFWRASVTDSGGDLSNPSATASFTTLAIAMDPTFGVVPDSMSVKKGGVEVTNVATITPADGTISPQLLSDLGAGTALNAGGASDLTKPGLMIAKEKGGAATDILGITTPVGARIDSVSTTNTTDAAFTNGPLPSGVDFPYGVVSFRISNVNPLSSVTIKIYPHAALPDSASWFKYSATRGWLRIDNTGTYDRNNTLLSPNTTFRVVSGHGELTIKDDDVADYSTEASGGKAVILDPGAPAVPAATPTITAGSGGNGSCFIATAAFGSYVDPYVKVLRDFRDVCLMTNDAGKAFVGWYYRVSPPMADVIKESRAARASVRVLLFPVIGFGALSLKIGMIWSLLLMLLVIGGAGVLIAGKKRR